MNTPANPKDDEGVCVQFKGVYTLEPIISISLTTTSVT